MKNLCELCAVILSLSKDFANFAVKKILKRVQHKSKGVQEFLPERLSQTPKQNF
jgi:hypothetical protein